MSMEDTALAKTIENFIKEIEVTGKPHGACGAHWPVVRGVQLLLECEAAHMKERADERAERVALLKERRKETIAVTVAVASFVSVFVPKVIPLLFK